MADRTEVILAQEQGAVIRGTGGKSEVESEFGFGEAEGTFILTDQRMIFVRTDEKVDDVPVGVMSSDRVIYAEVEDIGRIPAGPPNMFIPIASVTLVKGHGGVLEKPGLEVSWDDGGKTRSVVVTQNLIGRRKKTLRDWAPVVEDLKAGRRKLIDIPPAPSIDTLQGKIVRVLSDMQEKGVFEIENEVEEEFKADLEPDDVQAACDALASQGLLRRYPDSSGDVFYRRASPLGEDDLSS